MSRKLPPLNAIRAFEAAARHASFTKAAGELHVTHGAISQQIKSLEGYYGKPLFQRAKGKVHLNDDGLLLLPVFSEALNNIADISARLLDRTGSDVLTINLTAAFAAQWLMPRLGDFQQKYPNITIRLVPSSKFDGFAENGADVAIRWGRNSDPDTEMVKLFDVDAFVACAPSLITEDTPLKQPADILRHIFIHDDDGSAWATWLKQAGVQGCDASSGHFFSDSALALQAAVDGQGVITAGSILAARDLEAGRLVIPFDIFMRKRNAYYLSWPKELNDEVKVGAFKDWISVQASIYLKNKISLARYIV